MEVIIETGEVLWRPSRFTRSQNPAGHFRDTPRGRPRTSRVWAEMTRLAGRVVHSSPHSTTRPAPGNWPAGSSGTPSTGLGPESADSVGWCPMTGPRLRRVVLVQAISPGL